MAHLVADRVKETASTTGTGAFTLAGAVSAFRAFSALLSVGDTTWYCAVNGTEWEVGYGTYSSANTLTRTTVKSSSNANAAVNFSVAPTVFMTVPADSAAVPTGTGFDFYGSTLPAGYIFGSGLTLGSAASGATERANADTFALYSLFWNSMANTEAPVSTGRGASAAADFAANKTIGVPDLRGRVGVGKDNMGGTAASRITTAGAGIDGTVLGVSGGAQTVTLSTAQIPSHTHGLNSVIADDGGASYNISGTGSRGSAITSTGATGSGSAHTNTQPSYVCNRIIKL